MSDTLSAALTDSTARTSGTTASASSTPLAIEALGLRKAYGEKKVLDGIDLRIPEGSIFSLLGPNGAGKTTTVQILSTLVDPDAGQVRVSGHDLAKDAAGVRASIGVTGQFSAVDNLLTGEENLAMMCDLHHLGKKAGPRRVAELLEQFSLVDAANRYASTYSGGMRRRLDLAMTLVGDPRLIFLDEPTTGLDPRSRHDMWQIIRELVSGGVTIFLTTQYLEEADLLADRIAVLNSGRLVAEGTPDELKRLIPGGHIRLQFTDPGGYQKAYALFPDASPDEEAMVLQVAHDGSVPALKGLLDRMERESVTPEGLSVHTPDLDDVFFALTGQHKEKDSAR
ncbi:ATP-binding cassette domain-containing protein [Streptomyces sp. NPDC087300]|uniref:ATP-binding cassette domain-containing protein n=1 Tax=Streptomyces sp. NPDC087300 TaxID=3365780 RepID=UPI003824A45A